MPEENESRLLSRLIYYALNEKKFDSMTKYQQLAYKHINRLWLRETPAHRPSLCNWKENGYKFVCTVAVGITRKIKLPAQQEHKEVANVIETFMKLEEETEKAKKETIEERTSSTNQQDY